MSKFIEDKNDQRTNAKVISSMSSRQQIIYLIKESQNLKEQEEDKDKDKDKEVLDYSTYFMRRKEKIVSIR
jgi:hypothetical protein